jgi:lysophospholipid acyltransferase (LPLAT)-like uncharacterized protein
LIPKPGATVTVRIGEPIEVPSKLDEDGYESIRRLLEERMFSLHSNLDRQTGYHDPEPLRVPAV